MSITTIDITASGITAGEFYTRFDMEYPRWAASQIRVMRPFGAEKDAYLVEAANQSTVSAIRAWLSAFTVPAAKAQPAAVQAARCDHYETDNHGICHACGAYVASGDAARY